jgi:serine protease Do
LIEVSLLSLNLRRSALAAAAALLLVLPAGAPPVAARPAPDSFADLADKLLPSVVNISTTQTLKTDKQKERTPGRPQFPPGSPFEEFFKDFFKDHDSPQSSRPEAKPRKATSLGSGFVVDAGGIIVTNNHVIADADEITVKLADNTELKAEVVGRALGRQRQGAGRRLGIGDRQPVWSRRQRHRRHLVGAAARHPIRPL